MTRQLSTWLVAGLVGAGLISGCGESGSSTSTVTAAASPPAAAGAAAGGAAGAQGTSHESASQATSTTATVTPTTAGTTSSSVWNPVQCAEELRNLTKSNGGVSAAQLHAFKRTLREKHGCYTAKSLDPPPPTSGKPVWNSVQCGVALRALAKSHAPINAAQYKAYKRTLREKHGCYTAASLTPAGPPVKPRAGAKQHG